MFKFNSIFFLGGGQLYTSDVKYFSGGFWGKYKKRQFGDRIIFRNRLHMEWNETKNVHLRVLNFVGKS